MTEFNFSPTLNHKHITQNTRQLLGYKDGDVAVWQSSLRPKLAELLGDMPKERVPLNVRTIWKKDHPLGSIEKIVFTSETYSDVPAYVCLPKNARPPYTFFICLQGHSTGMHNSIAVDREDENKPADIENDKDTAIACMSRGIAALCIEQRSFGERREAHQPARSSDYCYDASAHAILLGRTLIGERVYDVDRGIDYLFERGDVRTDRIGVMGNSGGGAVTTYAAAMLPRIALAMPSCSFCTYSGSIMSIFHCICNYIPGIYKYAEMQDVLGLFAPKPVVVVTGAKDHIFPLESVKEAFNALKRIYAAAGAEDRCHLVIGSEGHRFYADDAWPVMLGELESLDR